MKIKVLQQTILITNKDIFTATIYSKHNEQLQYSLIQKTNIFAAKSHLYKLRGFILKFELLDIENNFNYNKTYYLHDY